MKAKIYLVDCSPHMDLCVIVHNNVVVSGYDPNVPVLNKSVKFNSLTEKVETEVCCKEQDEFKKWTIPSCWMEDNPIILERYAKYVYNDANASWKEYCDYMQADPNSANIVLVFSKRNGILIVGGTVLDATSTDSMEIEV